MSEDKHAGEGGSYKIGKDGIRRQVEKPTEVPAGGGARNSKGEPLDSTAPAEHNRPAMPAPPARAPWESAAPAKADRPAAEPSADKKGSQ